MEEAILQHNVVGGVHALLVLEEAQSDSVGPHDLVELVAHLAGGSSAHDGTAGGHGHAGVGDGLGIGAVRSGCSS